METDDFNVLALKELIVLNPVPFWFDLDECSCTRNNPEHFPWEDNND